jgi:lysophospholipase L1-like esterase
MPEFEFADQPMRWLFTGDSVTQGAVHTYGERDYVQLFEERLRWELGRRRDHVIRTAVSGRTIADLADDIEWSVLEYRPDVVSVMLGINDCQSATISAVDFIESYSALIRRIIGTGATVILHTPNRVRPAEACDYQRLPLFADAVRRLARDHGCLLVDHFEAWKRPEAVGATVAWLGETCHPNVYGHRAIAKLLLARLGVWDANAPSAVAAHFPHAAELG